MPSSDTRLSTPLEPTIDVLTAPASISVPTTATKARNIIRSACGPARYMVMPPSGLLKKFARTPSGMIITTKKAVPAVKMRLYTKITKPAFSRFFSFGYSISR